MSHLSKVLWDQDDGHGATQLLFWCPGCDGCHGINVGAGPGARWSWNGDVEKPTFRPSIRVTYNGADADTPDGIPSMCHSFVTDGRIQFLGDCTHALAGQTVDLPVWRNDDA